MAQICRTGEGKLPCLTCLSCLTWTRPENKPHSEKKWGSSKFRKWDASFSRHQFFTLIHLFQYQASSLWRWLRRGALQCLLHRIHFGSKGTPVAFTQRVERSTVTVKGLRIGP